MIVIISLLKSFRFHVSHGGNKGRKLMTEIVAYSLVCFLCHQNSNETFAIGDCNNIPAF